MNISLQDLEIAQLSESSMGDALSLTKWATLWEDAGILADQVIQSLTQPVNIEVSEVNVDVDADIEDTFSPSMR